MIRRARTPGLVETAGQRKRALGVSPHGRIWCAACSTGEEPYSVAMLLDELIQSRPRRDLDLGDFGILATDISPGALDVARAGIYNERDVVRGVRPPYQRRYFKQQPDGWQVVDPLRRLIDFRRGNLLDSTVSAGPFDLILCRNVLIYFNEETRRRVCRRFHAMLRPGGVLMLGAAENLYGVSEGFTSEQLGSAFFYRKCE